MSFVRRGRCEIVYSILNLLKDPTLITHILYRCNLTYNQVRKYLDFLSAKDLIRMLEEGSRTFYQTTDKGKGFVIEYERMERFFENS